MSLETDFQSKQEELAVKRAALAGIFSKIDETTDAAKRDELVKEATKSNRELADLVDAIEPIQSALETKRQNAEALKAMRQPNGRQVPPEDAEAVNRDSDLSDEIVSSGVKSVAALLRQNLTERGLKSFRGFRGELGELAVKTLITSADLTPLEDRQALIRTSAQEERTTSDLMLQGTTTAQKVTYFEETTFTNAAAETDEAAAKPEGAIDFTLREDNVRKIAVWVPVTDEMMEDVPAFESYLRGRLGFMVKQREELQILRGDGTGVNIQGVYNRTGVQTVSGYGLSTIDSILKAITEIQKDAFAEPTALVVHPNDWFEIRTSKDLNGQYLLGPATSNNDVRPWGLQVRVTTNALENTGLVGAFTPHAQIFRRSGISLAISTENEDYFIYNKLAVRAEERLALAVYRPAAFCKVEAIVQGS